jgi:hypothetical protein
VVIAERHGDVEMTQVMRAVQEDYARLIDQSKSEKKATALGNERDAAIRDIAAVRDRIRGVYGWDPGMANLGRITTAVKQVNNITSMGMSAIASLSDFAGAPIRYGIMSTFADGWVPFFKNMTNKETHAALAKQKFELKALGIGVDTALNLRQHAFDDITDGYKPQSRVERALQWTSDKFFVANLLAPLTDIQKQIAGNVAINQALRGVKADHGGQCHQGADPQPRRRRDRRQHGQPHPPPVLRTRPRQHGRRRASAEHRGLDRPGRARRRSRAPSRATSTSW